MSLERHQSSLTSIFNASRWTYQAFSNFLQFLYLCACKNHIEYISISVCWANFVLNKCFQWIPDDAMFCPVLFLKSVSRFLNHRRGSSCAIDSMKLKSLYVGWEDGCPQMRSRKNFKRWSITWKILPRKVWKHLIQMNAQNQMQVSIFFSSSFLVLRVS